MKTFFLILVLSSALIAGCETFDPAWMQWEYTGGPYAQNVTVLHADVRTPGVLYAGLANGQLFVSSSGGTTWSLLSIVSPQTPIARLIQDAEAPERIFAATSAGAFVSSNRGKNWSALSIDTAGTAVLTVALDPWSPAHMFAGTEGRGIFASGDGGLTWSSVSGAPEGRLTSADVFDIVVDPGKPDNVYAAVSTLGIIRSSDRGKTWEPLTQEFSSTGARTTHLLLRRGAAGEMLYATDAGSILKTINGGQSWIPSRNGREYDRIVSLTSHPSDPATVFAGTARGMLMSPDFGTTWTAIGGEFERAAAILVPGPPAAPFVLYAFGAGIGVRASSDNGRTWRQADNLLGGSTIRLMATDPSASHLFVGTGPTCLVLDASPQGEWTSAGEGIMGGTVSWITGDPQLPGVIYAATPAGIFKSMNAGEKWEPAVRGLRASPTGFEVHPFIKTRMFATADQGLFVSTDRGSSWTQARPLTARWRIARMTFSPKNAGVILATTVGGGLVLSTNGGFDWESARYGLPADPLTAITLDDKDQNVYYAYTARGECYRTMNKGIEWARYTCPWTSSDSVRVAFDRAQPNSVIALVNSKELYFSPSGGGSWFPVIDQQIDAEVVALHWNAQAACAFAGTLDKGVYRVRIGGRVREVQNE